MGVDYDRACRHRCPVLSRTHHFVGSCPSASFFRRVCARPRRATGLVGIGCVIVPGLHVLGRRARRADRHLRTAACLVTASRRTGCASPARPHALRRYRMPHQRDARVHGLQDLAELVGRGQLALPARDSAPRARRLPPLSPASAFCRLLLRRHRRPGDIARRSPFAAATTSLSPAAITTCALLAGAKSMYTGPSATSSMMALEQLAAHRRIHLGIARHQRCIFVEPRVRGAGSPRDARIASPALSAHSSRTRARRQLGHRQPGGLTLRLAASPSRFFADVTASSHLSAPNECSACLHRRREREPIAIDRDAAQRLVDTGIFEGRRLEPRSDGRLEDLLVRLIILRAEIDHMGHALVKLRRDALPRATGLRRSAIGAQAAVRSTC